MLDTSIAYKCKIDNTQDHVLSGSYENNPIIRA